MGGVAKSAILAALGYSVVGCLGMSLSFASELRNSVASDAATAKAAAPEIKAVSFPAVPKRDDRDRPPPAVPLVPGETQNIQNQESPAPGAAKVIAVSAYPPPSDSKSSP